MQIFSTIINLILVITGLVAFLWNIIGIPVGMVWGVIHLTQKNHKIDKKKWFWVTFGGMIILFIVFILYAVLGALSAILGFSFFSAKV